MKFLIVFVALFAVALAAPETVSFDNEQNENGNTYSFDTDGTEASELGQVKKICGKSVIVVRDTFPYVPPAGESNGVNYFADETGYHPVGVSLAA